MTIAVDPLAAAPQRPGSEALGALFSSLYAELSRLARREVWRNGMHGRMGTGTLVHEAWLDIARRPALAFEGPGRFLAYAARTMRGLVIDRLRAQGTYKRGSNAVVESLDEVHDQVREETGDLPRIVEALEELAVLEPDLACVVDLKYFCGFTLAEIAAMQGVSERTVERRWEKARLLLHRALS